MRKGFLLCFCGVFSGLRNVLLSIFSVSVIEKTDENLYCGEPFQKKCPEDSTPFGKALLQEIGVSFHTQKCAIISGIK
jgi:hypothetical protein